MESEQPEAEINYYRRATMFTKTAFLKEKQKSPPPQDYSS
jgi:hypothetical protein